MRALGWEIDVHGERRGVHVRLDVEHDFFMRSHATACRGSRCGVYAHETLDFDGVDSFVEDAAEDAGRGALGVVTNVRSAHVQV